MFDYLMRMILHGLKKLIFKDPSFEIFLSENGLKYKGKGYDSNDFISFKIDEFDFDPKIWSWDCLIMPPDFLKNSKTQTELSIKDSSHFALMQDIISNRLKNSEYIKRKIKGTLDARLPEKPRLRIIKKNFKERLDQLIKEKIVSISVIPIDINGRTKFVIVDGKHRTAMVAFFGEEYKLILNIISNKFTEHVFFQKTYKEVLNLDVNYSINKEIIKKILYEPKIDRFSPEN